MNSHRDIRTSAQPHLLTKAIWRGWPDQVLVWNQRHGFWRGQRKQEYTTAKLEITTTPELSRNTFQILSITQRLYTISLISYKDLFLCSRVRAFERTISSNTRNRLRSRRFPQPLDAYSVLVALGCQLQPQQAYNRSLYSRRKAQVSSSGARREGCIARSSVSTPSLSLS